MLFLFNACVVRWVLMSCLGCAITDAQYLFSAPRDLADDPSCEHLVHMHRKSMLCFSLSLSLNVSIFWPCCYLFLYIGVLLHGSVFGFGRWR